MNQALNGYRMRGYTFLERVPGQFELTIGRQWVLLLVFAPIGLLTLTLPLIAGLGLWQAINEREVLLASVASLMLIVGLVLATLVFVIVVKCLFPRLIKFDVASRTITGRHVPGFDRSHSFDEIESVELGTIADNVWIRLCFRSKRRPLILVHTQRRDEYTVEELMALVEPIARALAGILDCPLKTRSQWWKWRNPLTWGDPLSRSSWW